ncbi:MAG TPA: hypothetical protein VJ840_04075 [Gemmatimonadaceae bacterium]|nr:hypothetical protein [Gemmatimonadaceae bacterium]
MIGSRTNDGLQRWQRVLRRGRALYVSPDRVWASNGGSLLLSSNGGRSFDNLGLAPMRRRSWSSTAIGERLARAGFHALIEISPTEAVAIVTGGIVRWSNGTFSDFFSTPVGSRPLGMVRDVNNRIYFGEYWGNPTRDPVRIFVSEDDGRSWQIAFTFPRGSIRHVHAVLTDDFDRDALYILTGDEDVESAIYRTRDSFRTLEKLAHGSQLTRAIAAHAAPEGVYFATDTEREHNRVRLLGRDGRLTEVGEISGSGWGCCSVGTRLFFATAVEPSEVNRDRYARLYECSVGRGITQVGSARKDFLPKKAFQYGTFILPKGPGDGENLWVTPWSVSGHGSLLKLRLDEI